ncbi:MAG: NAD(P)-binding domain-containing protein, partial [Chloroflexi bacterium]|nr:NAD(P)-binding domain-containing protein [Chloroflexota bacterium]
MELAMIGLGRMGGNMLQRLLQGGHRVVAYARTAATVQQAEAEGAVGVGSLAEVAAALHMPRIIWMMVPAGAAVDQTIASLLPHLSAGDILVDGGNSNYKDSMRRAAEVKAKGFHFIDVGTSGGIWGLREGYCLMIGGDEEPVRQVEPIFASLASPGGYAHVGPSGAGHFVKMVHNGIEY